MTIKQNINIGANVGQQGLGAYTAASEASIAAGGSGLAGAQTVGKWLPWIGAGLAVYDWAAGDITGESTVQLGATWATIAQPWFGVVTVPAAITSYMMAQDKAHSKNFVKIVEPSLELIHRDDQGNYYLRGLNNRDQSLNPCDPTSDSTCQETYLRYNSTNNTLETVTIDRPAEAGWRTNSASGKDLEGAKWEEFDPVLWSIDGDDSTTGDDTVAWMVNMPSLQAQIYNQVLLPEGLAPMPDATPINLNGKEYYQDSAGVVYRSNGQIVGMYNEETGGVDSFIFSCDPKLGCRLHKADGSLDVTHGTYGVVSEGQAYVPSDDVAVIGMGPQALNANYAAWLDSVDPSADFVTPLIGENGITNEQYIQLEQAGSIKLGENQEDLGYSIDTSSGALLYNGTLIGSTQIVENNYIYTAGEWGQSVGGGEGKKIYAAQNTVWDLDGNILGNIEINNSGAISFQVNPGYDHTKGASVLSGSEDPSMFSWNTTPAYPEGTLGSVGGSSPVATTSPPTANITLPDQSQGLLSPTQDIGQEESPFATPGTWDPTTTPSPEATPGPETTTQPPPEETPPPDGGLLTPTIKPPVANISLPEVTLASTAGSPGLLSGDQQQQGQSPFSVPGTWDPTATLVKPVVPVPTGTQR